MYAWMKDYSVANYFLFQMNPKLVLIINTQYYINFHGNKLGPAGDFLLQKGKKRSYSDIPSGLFKQTQKDF